jgi:4-hydroxy-tetrahydrodipicolinate synthase
MVIFDKKQFKNMKINWTGVYPAVLTPFKKDDTIDYDMFDVNITAQIDAGVNGIILAGSLGEASTLSAAEKIELLKHAVKFVNGKVPVIMNIAEQSTRDAIDLAKASAANNADGLMLLPPMRYYADDNETVQYFRDVALSTELPIILYNNPVDYKIMISLDMFEAMKDLPTIQAVKESTRDITNITRMVNRFGSRFKILCGVDTVAMESLCMGADGWVAGLVDAFPRETVAIYRLVKAGRLNEALTINRWFMPLLELDIQPKLVQYIKMAAAYTGISTTHVRAPRLLPVGEELKKVNGIIESALAVRPTLPDYLNL